MRSNFGLTSLVGLCLMLALLISSRPALGKGLATILGLAEVLESSGKALQSIADGIESAVNSGANILDVISARQAKSRLKEITAQTSILVGVQSAKVIDRIDLYLKNPSANNWKKFQNELPKILNLVEKLISDITSERSDFVAVDQPSYEKFVRSLKRREILLKELIQMPAPKSKNELYALAVVRTKYSGFMTSLRSANRALSSYIVAAEQSPRGEEYREKDTAMKPLGTFLIEGPNDENFPISVKISGSYRRGNGWFRVLIQEIVYEIDPHQRNQNVSLPLMILERCGVLSSGFYEQRRHPSSHAQNFLGYWHVDDKERPSGTIIRRQNISRMVPVSKDAQETDWFCLYIRGDIDGKTRYVHAESHSKDCKNCDSLPVK